MDLFSFLKRDSKADRIKEALNRNAFLVDVRTPAEFAGGSVPSAVNISLNNLPEKINKFKGKSAVIVFCASGMRSKQAKRILEHNGIKNVINGGSWLKVNKIIQR